MSKAVHDEAGRRFVIATPAGEAYVPYVLEGKSVNFHDSYVPPALRGKGLGRELVIACKAWAESKGYDIQASCGYVAMTLGRLK